MNVFLCGGSGLLGSHIAVRLLEKGHTVTVFARNPEKVPQLTERDGVRVVKGAFTDEALLAKALPGHDACITTVLNYGHGARKMSDTDVRPNVALAEIAAEAGVGHFIFTSSTAAVGDYRHNMDESLISLPIDYYCAGQRSIEQFLLAISYLHPTMRCNIIRPGYFFGCPAFAGGRVHRGTIVEQIATKARAGEDIEVMDRMGTQYLGVADLAKVFLAVLEGEMNREIYFALGKPWYSNRKVAEEAIRQIGSSSKIVVTENPDPQPPKEFTLTKIKEHFGFEFDSWPHIVAFLEYLYREVVKEG